MEKGEGGLVHNNKKAGDRERERGHKRGLLKSENVPIPTI
jgi:hypothetical protein